MKCDCRGVKCDTRGSPIRMNANREMVIPIEKLLWGEPPANAILAETRRKSEVIARATGRSPVLATLRVGNDPSSEAYQRMAEKRAASIGVEMRLVAMPRESKTDEVLARVGELARDQRVHGIVVRHPIPGSIDKRAVLEAIPMEKDVDGAGSAALGRVILGLPAFAPCTPEGIMRLLAFYRIELEGMHAVVLGRSPVLGRPLASMLINAHATVTLCHSRTRDIEGIVNRGDLIIAAIGRPRFVRGEWIKEGTIVVDAGYSEGNIGDVEFGSAIERASHITPVPGGVGPMTISVLLSHVVDSAAAQLGVRI